MSSISGIDAALCEKVTFSFEIFVSLVGRYVKYRNDDQMDRMINKWSHGWDFMIMLQ